MANKLSPFPVGIHPGSSYWSDLYERIRFEVNNLLTQLDWNTIVNKPTTLSGYGITDAQNISGKDAANGYAGLNSVSRITKGIDTTDDVIVDSITKGIVLKSANGHYWRSTISNAGVLTWTDLGTTKP